MSPSTSSSRSFLTRPITWIIVIVVILVLIAGVVIGTRIYASSQNDAAPEAFASSTALPDAEPGSADGSWTVADGSEAGYRVDEVLNGEDVTVVGRTGDVTGAVEITDSALTEGQVIVDLSTVTTDSDQRDQYFRSQAVNTSIHADATFTLDGPGDLGDLAESGSATVTVPGSLEINGTTQQVEAELQVTRTPEGTLAVSGASDLTWSDYGVEAPDLGFVSVQETGQIEYSLILTEG